MLILIEAAAAERTPGSFESLAGTGELACSEWTKRVLDGQRTRVPPNGVLDFVPERKNAERTFAGDDRLVPDYFHGCTRHRFSTRASADGSAEPLRGNSLTLKWHC